MLSDDVYDAFMLVPLYLSMYYKENLHIHGCVSKRLYRNVMNYVQRIMCDFCDDLSRVDVHVDGFKTADGEPEIIGTGLSSGVDSFSTIYDRYVNEDDPDYRVNALFFFNTGWHGDYYSPETMPLCMTRYNMNKPVADELGLPLYFVDSNFHAFAFSLYPRGCAAEQGKYIIAGGRVGYLANFSCVMGLQRAVKMYYIANAFSYYENLDFGKSCRNHDICEFSESFLLPLLRTEKLELIIEGCQYERSMKTERISDWNIAQKNLNVCNVCDETGHNCSKCGKCLRTLIALESISKLNDFSGVFDLNTYRKHSFRYKCEVVFTNSKEAFSADCYSFAKAHGLELPSYPTACVYLFSRRVLGFLVTFPKKLLRKIIGDKFYDSLKHTLKR